MRTIPEMIEAKKKGEDCTEEESAYMKKLVQSINFYFHIEFMIAMDDYLDYAGSQFLALGPSPNFTTDFE